MMTVGRPPPAAPGAGHDATGSLAPAARGIRRDTSVPSPGALRTVAVPPRRVHPGVHRLGQPLPVGGHGRRVEALPPVPHVQRHRVRLDLGEHRDHGGAGPLGRVDRGLPPGAQQRPEIVVELAVPDQHDLDRDPVLGLDLLLDLPHSGGQRQVRALQGARRAAVEQPRAQLALLRPGQGDDLLRVAGPALDQGQRLQDRVVHPGGHVGPLLGAGPGLPLDDQVAGDPQPPRAQRHDNAGDDQPQAADGRQQQAPLVPHGHQDADAAARQDQGQNQPER